MSSNIWNWLSVCCPLLICLELVEQWDGRALPLEFAAILNHWLPTFRACDPLSKALVTPCEHIAIGNEKKTAFSLC